MTQGGPYGAFDAPLTVAVVDSSGAVHRERLHLTPAVGSTQQVRVSLAQAPASVVLDPDVELLAVLKVVQK